MNWEDALKNLKNQLIQINKCKILPDGSYLAGGTAVSLFLNHRISVDLDFFAPKKFNSQQFIYAMEKCFKKDVVIELIEENTVILFISDLYKIKFSLFFYPYPLLSQIESIKINKNINSSLASLKDIEAMKALAITQRGSAKDFVDLFFLLKNTHHHFKDILTFVKKKYGVESRYEYHLKTSFVYFDDAEKEKDSIMLIKKSGQIERMSDKEWKDIKHFFCEFIK
ncbi:MAG: nucleotidyl transferase AbiEii/AbiGii toxin family protein [Candidatus Aminicenantes bacterium]